MGSLQELPIASYPAVQRRHFDVQHGNTTIKTLGNIKFRTTGSYVNCDTAVLHIKSPRLAVYRRRSKSGSLNG